MFAFTIFYNLVEKLIEKQKLVKKVKQNKKMKPL